MYLRRCKFYVLCISTLALSRPCDSFLPGAVLRSGSAVFKSPRSISHLSCAIGDVNYCHASARVARLRGGGQAATVHIADGSNESPGARGAEGDLSSTEQATTAVAGVAQKKRWLLGVSEHDG